MRALAARLGLEAVESLGTQRDGSFAERIAAAGDEAPTVARGPDDLAAILYTSGTTGRSKGAMLTHDNLASNALTLAELWRFSADDVLIHALPVFHTHGLFVAVNVALVAGATMIFQPRFDADAVVAALPRATTLMGVPTFYTRLLDHPGLTREATAHMRLFVSGSAPLLAETHARWRDKTGHAMLERYGMTETNMITSNPYDGERRPGAVGFPLPGVSLRVADPDSGAILPQGEVGVVEVKGPNVFKGYWRMPEKTASEFRADGFFITGDLGMIDADGYLHIVGRAKDLIISGGFNVYPKEIESEIDAIAGVVESAVIGVPHRDFGEGVTAIVVARADARARRGGDPVGARRPAGEIQAAQARAVRRRAAAQRDGQGAEGGAARDAQGDLRRVGRAPLPRRSPRPIQRVRAVTFSRERERGDSGGRPSSPRSRGGGGEPAFAVKRNARRFRRALASSASLSEAKPQ